jgi:hypothetical protein
MTSFHPTRTDRFGLPSYEFGGPIGVTFMMGFFPLLMYYFWICLWFYDGQLVHPKSLDDIKPFFLRMAQHICEVCRRGIRFHRKK